MKGRSSARSRLFAGAPVWKTSYRLELRQDKKPFLQGWAIVENATENDWNNVRLSLISGRPISFRMDLYTPLYVPRPVEQMELYASLRPPEYEGQIADTTGRWQAYADAETAPAEDAAARAAAGADGQCTQEQGCESSERILSCAAANNLRGPGSV